MGVGPRRERKVVTVLFADLVGFTSRAEQMDPEDVAAELARYQSQVRSELERYGGTVEKFIGDAVMAIFGAPTTHEDDPERAVRAALAICEWATEIGVEIRVGISTGEALVTLGARPEAGETMAAGDVVNTAARLQVAAPINGILVTEPTYRATSAALDYELADPVVAKGKSQPVPAWRATHARSRVSVERAHGAALVGRARELEMLAGSLDRAREESAPELVTIVGVPGIGKSRLVLELFERIEQEPEFTIWRSGHCMPYGDGITFWALGEMVKAQAAILDGDDVEEASAKLLAVVADPWVEAHLRPLVGLPGTSESGGDRRDEAFAAWRSFFEALAEQHPLVLVFEDLHWADDALLDFIDYLVEWTGPLPLLVVSTARPELLTRRPGWGGGKPNALTISLSPLSDTDMAQLLSALLDRSVILADTQTELLARAGGNPLYAEEYSRMLVDRGGVEELPETVQGMIAARLDLLDPTEKALLQNAAVIGRHFWVGAVMALGAAAELEDSLHSLHRKEFIRRERTPLVSDEVEYSFRHVLVRDVAYSQIPRGDRSDKHRAVAEWIETLGRREDHAEMLAHHYLESLDLAAAAGLDVTSYVDAARSALTDAGNRADALYAYDAAERYYRRALELTPSGDSSRGRLLLQLGRTSTIGSSPDPAILEDAREELLRAGDTEAAADAETTLASLYWYRGERDLCFLHLDRARELVEELPSSRVKAVTVSNASRFSMLAGQEEEAIRLGEEALAMAEELGLDEVRAAALSNMGAARGRRREDGELGLDQLRTAIEIAERSQSIFELCRAKGNLAAHLWLRGDLATALDLWRQAGDTAERFGQISFARWDHALQMKAYSFGEWDEAIRRATALIDEVEAGSPHYLAGQAYGTRARVRLARDDTAGASADIEKALAAARRAKDPQALYQTIAFAVDVLLPTGNVERAKSLAEEYLDALRMGVSLGSGLEESISVAAALVEFGRGPEIAVALESFHEPWPRAAVAVATGLPLAAADICAEMGARSEEAHLRLLAARAGDRRQLDAVLSFYRGVAATRYVREAETLLGASA